jgi:transposase
MDSASIYGANATWDLVFGLLTSKNIRLIWLPKYSPEFNPMELFWWSLKGQICGLPRAEIFVHLQELVVNITASIAMNTILGWFCQTITAWQKPK